MVSVPVLSNAITVVAPAVSSATASRIRMPFFAPTPVPTMMAVGVARPRAQGQAITRTATACRIAGSQPWPASSQPATVTAAITSTTGTNTALIWSTRRWIGALAPCASATMRTMRLSMDSAPTAVTRTSSSPSPLTAPPIT